MRYEDLDEGLSEKWRDEFPVTRSLVYLNHAAVAPLPRRASAAIQWLAKDAEAYGSLHYDQWMACYEDVRTLSASLINAEPSEIALVKNTSEGIATVALGFPWRNGDRIVAFREEFPANYYIWKKLSSRGVEVRWLSILDPLEKVEEACRGARLLAVSFVQYLSGYRIDLKAFGDICKRHGVFFFCDAIQGLGAFPLDVREANIAALAADGHKWLLGPEGCGILYISKEWQDQIEPVEFGWTNVAAYADYSSRDMTLRADAGRYECGTLNTVGCYGLRASLELLKEVGVEAISKKVQGITDYLAERACQVGYEIMGTRTPKTGAGIVCLRHPKFDYRMVHAQLRSAGIATAPRQGWVRCSPHFYISSEQIDRMIEGLPQL